MLAAFDPYIRLLTATAAQWPVLLSFVSAVRVYKEQSVDEKHVVCIRLSPNHSHFNLRVASLLQRQIRPPRVRNEQKRTALL